MSEVNWSRAPKSATHWDEESELFLKRDENDSGWLFWMPNLRIWATREQCGMLLHVITVIRRPSSAWPNGIPPVGTKCEARKYGKWHSGEVLKHSQTGGAAFMTDSLPLDLFFSDEFRPKENG